MEQNSKFLIFSLSVLTDLTIIINRKSKISVSDTLSLYWESKGIPGRNLFPYRIDNYGKPDNHYGLTTGEELRWIGGTVNSRVYTRVFADTKTKLLWDLDRYGRRKEFIDTITCRRDFSNTVYFTY